MQKILLVTIVLLFSVISADAQNAVLKGVVTLKNDQQPCAGANVYFSGITTGTATNNQGEIRLSAAHQPFTIRKFHFPKNPPSRTSYFTGSTLLNNQH